MWSGWAVDLTHGLEAASGLALRDDVYRMLGFDPLMGRAIAGGRLAATPMARLRDLTADLLVDHGLSSDAAAKVLATTWHAPDPVALARPVTDLKVLLDDVRAGGRRIAIATTDDRAPTRRTLEALGIDGYIDATICADDGVAPKPAPDMVRRLCSELGIAPRRTAVVGDSAPDLAMGRAAGVARCYGVLTGVGTRDALAPLADAVLDSVADLIGA